MDKKENFSTLDKNSFDDRMNPGMSREITTFKTIIALGMAANVSPVKWAEAMVDMNKLTDYMKEFTLASIDAMTRTIKNDIENISDKNKRK